jgi:hypothetical protein
MRLEKKKITQLLQGGAVILYIVGYVTLLFLGPIVRVEASARRSVCSVWMIQQRRGRSVFDSDKLVCILYYEARLGAYFFLLYYWAKINKALQPCIISNQRSANLLTAGRNPGAFAAPTRTSCQKESAVAYRTPDKPVEQSVFNQHQLLV